MCFDVSIPIRLICSTDGLLCLRSATTSVWHTRCRRGPSTPAEDADAVVLEGAEIVLAIRVVRGSEVVVGTHALQDCRLIFDRKSSDAAGDEYVATGEILARLVIEQADAF